MLSDMYSTILIRRIWCPDHYLRYNKKLTGVKKYLDQEGDPPWARISFCILWECISTISPNMRNVTARAEERYDILYP